MIIKNQNRLLIVIALTALLNSCAEKLDISTIGQAIPVVIAVINPEDSIHSIRINHSFKGNADAAILAQNPDSICYDTLAPKLEFYTKTGWKYHEINFLPVENSIREEGYFSRQGLQLYQFQSKISDYFIQGTHVVLNIPQGPQQEKITAIVEFIKPPRIFAPKQGLHTHLDFYPASVEVIFEDPPEFAKYELHVMFHIKNIMTNGDTVLQTIDKTFTRDSENNGRLREYAHMSIWVPGDLILAQVRQIVKKDSEVDYRLFDRIEFVLHTGSAEFYNYIDLNRISDDYGGQVITNITGGIGIFALKYQTKVTSIFLGPITMDSLIHGRYTRHLNFKVW
jgi:hypothetical protein